MDSKYKVKKSKAADKASDIDSFSFPKGLNEDVIKRISKIKGEPRFLLELDLILYPF